MPGAVEHYFVCTGNGAPPPACRSFYETDASGRYLPKLLARAGLSEDSVGRIFLGSFSAGGGLWKRVLSVPADRARITAAVLGDSAYEAAPPNNPVPVEGYVQFALEVMGDQNKFFFASVSSNPNPSTEQPGVVYASGSQTLAATRAEIERRSGRSFRVGGSLPLSYQPDALYTIGNNLIFADFGQTRGASSQAHQFHANSAPDFWRNILQPWLAQSGAGRSTGDVWPWIFVVAVGTAAGYWAYGAWESRHE